MTDPDTIYQQRPPAVLTVGTPASPEIRLTEDGKVHGSDGLWEFGCRCGVCTKSRDMWKSIGEKRSAPAPQQSPIVMIRPSGPHASELYVRTSGGEVITVPLSYGILINMLEDATAGLRRCEETR